eukprot:1973395-Ditylum_brightwellii.AAC.1
MKRPGDLFDNLKEQKYRLKRVGEITCHLGGNFFYDPNSMLAWGAKIYVKQIIEQSESIFGSLPKVYIFPIGKENWPEFDQPEKLPYEEIEDYQSSIG